MYGSWNVTIVTISVQSQKAKLYGYWISNIKKFYFKTEIGFYLGNMLRI